MSELIKYQGNSNLVKKVDSYLTHLGNLLQKRYAPDLPDLIPYRKGDKWGFCDRDKKIVIECKYDRVMPFIEGIAKVFYAYNIPSYIDMAGNQVINLASYDNDADRSSIEDSYLEEWNEKIAMVSKSELNFDDYVNCYYYKFYYGFIDRTGKEIIPCIYEKAIPFREGIGGVYVDESKPDDFVSSNRWVFINSRAQTLFKYDCHKVMPFSEFLAAVEINTKWGFIDKEGSIIITPTYQNTTSFCEGLAAVQLKSKWGFINNDGVIIIDFLYDDVDFFENGLCSIKVDGKWGFINSRGEVVVDIIYDSVLQYNSISKCWRHYVSFREGLAAVGLNNKFGYIDESGNSVVDFIYDEITPFSSDIAFVKADEKSFYIDKKGIRVLDSPFRNSGAFENGLALSSCIVGGDDVECGGYIDKLGNQYWED